MFITVINDCQDANAFGRQLTRISSLFNFGATPVGAYNDIEAAGEIIDMIDASEGREGVIIVNIAPRNGPAKKWKNGTPFGYFHYKRTLVVISIDGYTLSLVKKYGLTKEVKVFDIPTVLDALIEKKILDHDLRHNIVHTQFRSYEFLPRIAHYVYTGVEVPTEKLDIKEVADIPKAIWFVDNFGNLKTTLFKDEVDIVDNTLKTKFGTFNVYDRLSDVPDKEFGVVTGSSGLGEQRFLEIVIQGGNASKFLRARSGDMLFE